MAQPLQLFIKPPYTDWTEIHGYGADPLIASRIHTHLLLEKIGTAPFVAAAAGKLSARPPQGGLFSANEPVTIPAAADPLPSSVILYLHLSPLVTAGNPAFRTRALGFSGISAFAYFNVATSSLEAGLAELLDAATVPAGALTRAQVVDQLVRGVLDVPVTAGHAMGEASSRGAAAGSVRLGFTVVTRLGPLDPAHVYDHMRDFVEDGQADLDAFLALAPKSWPVIDPSTSTPSAIQLTQSALYAWPILDDLRVIRGLTAAEWRTVHDNQKALWRQRLLKRSGHAPAGSTAPPFAFDDLDWKNLFQLEAVVEFYVNYPDPWAPGAVPRNPGDPGYITVEFLDPVGDAATAAGNVVTLDGNPDLTRVREYYNFHAGAYQRRDYLFLESDTARATKMYRITAVDDAANTVTLDGSPVLDGGTSAWKIQLRPVGVIIDCFGGRLKGEAATSAGSVLTLDGNPDLSKVNRNFDTVYLPSDTVRATRTYRITAVDNAAKTVTLDGSPTLDGGTAGNTSEWHIQAGVGGELPNMFYNLGPGGARGYDHFDGIMLVVFNGEVRRKIRWTSFTSRDYAPGHQFLSSLRGNRAYDFMTYRSGNAFRNYSVRIVDQGRSYDGVHEARFYFATPVTADSVPAGTAPNGGGKTEIRLHYSGMNSVDGCDSAGCLVSPSYHYLRDELIEVYQGEYAAFNGPGTEDAQVQKAHGRSQADSETLWNTAGAAGLNGANWNDKIVGTFWVVRPDERPL